MAAVCTTVPAHWPVATVLVQLEVRPPIRRRWQAAWLDPYAVPTDVYDALNLPDRRNYLIDPWDGPDEIRALLEDVGLNDTSMTLAIPASWPSDPLGQLSAPEESKHLIRLAVGEPGELTLVACRRPADAVLLRDFGVANDDAPPGIFTGVLRSWETRFGLVPVMLDPAWTSFQVIAPPTGEAEVERLATEVVCFAMDSAYQGGFHVLGEDNNVRPQELVRSREWQIWWD